MVMMLMPASVTWSWSIDVSTDMASLCSPFVSTGKVSHTFSLGLACSRLAMACARRVSAPKLSSAVPSMSRSIVFTL